MRQAEGSKSNAAVSDFTVRLNAYMVRGARF